MTETPGIGFDDHFVDYNSDDKDDNWLYRSPTRSSSPPALPGASGSDLDIDITDDTGAQLSEELADETACNASVTPQMVSQDRTVRIELASQPAGESYGMLSTMQ